MNMLTVLKRKWFKVVLAALIALPTLSLGAGSNAYAEGPADPAPYITAKGTPNGKKVLFDNTHGQTAGAADWVIDGGFSDFANGIADKAMRLRNCASLRRSRMMI